MCCGNHILAAAVAGAAPQEVVPVDGAAFQGELVSVDASGGTTFRIAESKDNKSEVKPLPAGGLVRWGNPVAPRPQTIVVLTDGGQIVTAADWAGGAAVRLAGGNVVLLSDVWNEVKLPRKMVSGIVFAQQTRADDRERFVERVRSGSSTEAGRREAAGAPADAVMLINGDRLTGKLTELDRGSLAIDTRGGVARLPLSRVDAIVLGNNTHDDSSHERKIELVGLRDGSSFRAKSILANADGVAIELLGGTRLKGAVVDLVAIQPLGGRVVYLSDLDGANYRHVPYLTVSWPYSRDRNVLGEPIVVRGKRFWKGIGMHSAARLTFQFDGDFQRFDAAVALDDSAKGRGSVEFGAYILRDGKWSEAYKSGIVRGSEAPEPVSIDLRGAHGLTLTADYGDQGDELDHAVWLDARLVK